MSDNRPRNQSRSAGKHSAESLARDAVNRAARRSARKSSSSASASASASTLTSRTTSSSTSPSASTSNSKTKQYGTQLKASAAFYKPREAAPGPLRPRRSSSATRSGSSDDESILPTFGSRFGSPDPPRGETSTGFAEYNRHFAAPPGEWTKRLDEHKKKVRSTGFAEYNRHFAAPPGEWTKRLDEHKKKIRRSTL